MLSPDRKGKVTGSMAGAILGLSPFMSREDAIQTFLGNRKFEGNAATEYGKFHEEYAFADLQAQFPTMALNVDDKFFAHDGWLGATPDGFYHEDDAIIEIKCPFGLRENTNPEFKTIEQQPHYYAQVQIEMFCTGKKRAYFFQWNRYKSDLQIIDLDTEWLNENLPKLKAFLDEVEQRRENADTDEQLAHEYHEAKAAFDTAKKRLDESKDHLIKKANGQKRKFGDVSVYPVERKGSVSYASIVKEQLPDFDVEPYRGKPSTSWVVK